MTLRLGLLLAAALLAGCTAVKTVTTPSGLQLQTLRPGAGAEAKRGMFVTIHYTGWLKDGAKLDSTYERRQPLTFRLGEGRAIAGLDEGVTGMRVGGRRRLIIPPALGYGATGTPGGPFPPNATLVYEVELLSAG